MIIQSLVAAALFESIAKAATITTLTSSWTDRALYIHREQREALVNGEVHGVPQAASMPTMYWDTGLAADAAIEAARTNSDGTMYVGHHPNTPNAENLAYSSVNDASIDALHSGWIAEVNCWTYSNNGCSGCSACGHYTSMISARNIKVGCAVGRDFPTSSSVPYRSKLVCHYSSGGSSTSWPYDCKYSGCPEVQLSIPEPSCVTVVGGYVSGDYELTSSGSEFSDSIWTRKGNSDTISWSGGRWQLTASYGLQGWCINNAYDPTEAEWSGTGFSTQAGDCADPVNSGCITISGLWSGANGAYEPTSNYNNQPAWMKSGGGAYLYWGCCGYWFLGTTLGSNSAWYLCASNTNCWTITDGCSGGGFEVGDDIEEPSSVNAEDGTTAGSGETITIIKETEKEVIASWSWLILVLGLLCMMVGVLMTVRSWMKSKVRVSVPSDEQVERETADQRELVETA